MPQGTHKRFDDECDPDATMRDATDDLVVVDDDEEDKEEPYDFGPEPEFRPRQPMRELLLTTADSSSMNDCFFCLASANDVREKKNQNAAVYVTSLEANVNFDAFVAISSGVNKPRVFSLPQQQPRKGFCSSFYLEHPISSSSLITDCYFPSSSRLSNVIVTSSLDGTVREFDDRTINDNAMNEVRASNTFTIPNAKGKCETVAYCGGSNEHLAAVGFAERIAFFDRRKSGGCWILKTFEDVHSETITKLRFNPGNRRALHSASVDGLTCTFDVEKQHLDEEKSLVSVGTANAAINQFGFLGSKKNTMWTITGIEEIHLFDCDATDSSLCGDEIGRVKNTRERAREAAKLKLQNQHKSSPQGKDDDNVRKGLKDLAESVDYVISVVEGPYGEFLAILGTIKGTVGMFPIAYVYSSNPTSALTLLEPIQILNNEQGHKDIVRCLAFNFSRAYTGGEDSLICEWVGGNDAIQKKQERNVPNNDRSDHRETPY